MELALARRTYWTALVFALGLLLAGPAAAHPEDIWAISTTNTLLRFDSSSPGTIVSSVAVTGLQVGEQILAIDFRPLNGQLYGLGSTSRLYTINRTTGAATQVGSGTFSTPLSGTSFGFDFNPVADRIRVVSDAEQNLRLNPDTGTVAAADSNLNPAGSVVAAAYTNSFPGATSTTLYGIDSASDMLVLIGGPSGVPSANGGS
jgi:hypothetical protein